MGLRQTAQSIVTIAAILVVIEVVENLCELPGALAVGCRMVVAEIEDVRSERRRASDSLISQQPACAS